MPRSVEELGEDAVMEMEAEAGITAAVTVEEMEATETEADEAAPSAVSGTEQADAVAETPADDVVTTVEETAPAATSESPSFTVCKNVLIGTPDSRSRCARSSAPARAEVVKRFTRRSPVFFPSLIIR